MRSRLQCLALLAPMLLATTVSADELFFAYLDDHSQEQTLTIDTNASIADNALAASLILQGNSFIVTLDEKADLDVIAASVSEQAPDQATAIAVSNTILGIGVLLGGRSVVRSSIAPVADAPPVDTPPVPPPAVPVPSPSSSPPPPSSTVVSPN